MAKLLNTRLPLAQGDDVSADTFNRLVRLLEINLNAFDPVATLSMTTEERDSSSLNRGTIIFNTTSEVCRFLMALSLLT